MVHGWGDLFSVTERNVTMTTRRTVTTCWWPPSKRITMRRRTWYTHFILFSHLCFSIPSWDRRLMHSAIGPCSISPSQLTLPFSAQTFPSFNTQGFVRGCCYKTIGYRQLWKYLCRCKRHLKIHSTTVDKPCPIVPDTTLVDLGQCRAHSLVCVQKSSQWCGIMATYV